MSRALSDVLQCKGKRRFNDESDASRVQQLLHTVVKGVAECDEQVVISCCEKIEALAAVLQNLWEACKPTPAVSAATLDAVAVEILATIGILAHGHDDTCREMLRGTQCTTALFKLLVDATDSRQHRPGVVAAAAGMLALFEPLPPYAPGMLGIYMDAAQNALQCALSPSDADLSVSKASLIAYGQVGAQGIWLLDSLIRKVALGLGAKGGKHANVQGQLGVMFADLPTAPLHSPSSSSSLLLPCSSWPADILRLCLHPRLCAPRDTLLSSRPLDHEGARLMDCLITVMHPCAASPRASWRKDIAPLARMCTPSHYVLVHHLAANHGKTVLDGCCMVAAVLRMLGPYCLEPACTPGQSASSLRHAAAGLDELVHPDLVLGSNAGVAQELVQAVLDQLWGTGAGKAAGKAGAGAGASSMSHPQPTLLELLLSTVLLSPCVASPTLPNMHLAALGVVRDAACAVADAIEGTGVGQGKAVAAVEYLMAAVVTIVSASMSPSSSSAGDAPGSRGRATYRAAIRIAGVHTLMCIAEQTCAASKDAGLTAQCIAICQHAVSTLLNLVQEEVVQAAEAMPQDWDEDGKGEQGQEGLEGQEGDVDDGMGAGAGAGSGAGAEKQKAHQARHEAVACHLGAYTALLNATNIKSKATGLPLSPLEREALAGNGSGTAEGRIGHGKHDNSSGELRSPSNPLASAPDFVFHSAHSRLRPGPSSAVMIYPPVGCKPTLSAATSPYVLGIGTEEGQRAGAGAGVGAGSTVDDAMDDTLHPSPSSSLLGIVATILKRCAAFTTTAGVTRDMQRFMHSQCRQAVDRIYDAVKTTLEKQGLPLASRQRVCEHVESTLHPLAVEYPFLQVAIEAGTEAIREAAERAAVSPPAGGHGHNAQPTRQGQGGIAARLAGKKRPSGELEQPSSTLVGRAVHQSNGQTTSTGPSGSRSVRPRLEAEVVSAGSALKPAASRARGAGGQGHGMEDGKEEQEEDEVSLLVTQVDRPRHAADAGAGIAATAGADALSSSRHQAAPAHNNNSSSSASSAAIDSQGTEDLSTQLEGVDALGAGAGAGAGAEQHVHGIIASLHASSSHPSSNGLDPDEPGILARLMMTDTYGGRGDRLGAGAGGGEEEGEDGQDLGGANKGAEGEGRGTAGSSQEQRSRGHKSRRRYGLQPSLGEDAEDQ